MEKIAIYGREDCQVVVQRIIDLLEDKTFTIVSYHTSFPREPVILHKFSLRKLVPIVDGTQFRLLLYPRKVLVFDLKEKTTVTFDEDRIKIVRQLSAKDTVTREILVNLEKRSRDIDAQNKI